MTTSLARRVIAVYTRQAPAFQPRSRREVISWAAAIDRQLKRRPGRRGRRASVALTVEFGVSLALIVLSVTDVLRVPIAVVLSFFCLVNLVAMTWLNAGATPVLMERRLKDASQSRSPETDEAGISADDGDGQGSSRD
ncbi:hypothetical protein [Streptomyces olivochromogenes]|uniref:Uncharacterized protein n=1 Tax=Streptomyces olivochromogenes TaxID=1963 RepID=A0A250VF90_STROL|nr:hypothetical protein [Streptomyces olivochromogenes]KUN47429.1 hypothetical protein AQJ27_10865 [Streptomyces olivochromogenes]GAX52845.1 hypothetical protein SO3561_04364 [Streptomyces olivochromogenes]